MIEIFCVNFWAKKSYDSIFTFLALSLTISTSESAVDSAAYFGEVCVSYHFERGIYRNDFLDLF